MDAVPMRRRPRLLSLDEEMVAALGSLDSLPPELLNAILSRLPIRDAVRTSALARAWRRRWESVPSLKFEWGEDANPGAITGVLQRYACPVLEFHHSCVGRASLRHSNRWLRLLALRGVQTLELTFRNLEHHTLRSSIFSCRELMVLHLDSCDFPAMPPNFAGLPNLTVLYLSNVGFPEGAEALSSLIATSPLLESLSLGLLRMPDISDGYDEWVIQAPKLRVLCVADLDDHGWQISDLPCLEVAIIDYAAEYDFIKLVRALAFAQRIKLHIPAEDNVLEGLSCPFNNLKHLFLDTSLSVLSCVLSVFCLLRNAPKLEELHIKINDYYSQKDEVDSDLLNAQWANDLFSNLRSVHVINVMCKLSEMHFIEFILSKARQLRELHVCLEEDCPKSNEQAVTELVKYRRASPRAKVFFSRMTDD